jgi:hypothetical protein
METEDWFIPEAFTHLYHTSCYARLSEEQRCKYNKLYGLRINEQFIQFEELFIGRLMPRLQRHRRLKGNPSLLNAIESVLRDEEQHSRMFGRFNQTIRPDLYRQSHSHFTRLSPVEHLLFKLIMITPGILPALLWLLLAMEELTTAISDALISHPHAADYNQTYLALHRTHLHDEKRHVGIDRKLIIEALKEITPARHRLNAFLFRNLFLNILKPRRSTVQVIHQLIREEPGLRRDRDSMIREIAALDLHKAFPANLVTPDTLPVLHALTDRYPEYRFSVTDRPA